MGSARSQLNGRGAIVFARAELATGGRRPGWAAPPRSLGGGGGCDQDDGQSGGVRMSARSARSGRPSEQVEREEATCLQTHFARILFLILLH